MIDIEEPLMIWLWYLLIQHNGRDAAFSFLRSSSTMVARLHMSRSMSMIYPRLFNTDIPMYRDSSFFVSPISMVLMSYLHSRSLGVVRVGYTSGGGGVYGAAVMDIS